MSKSKLNLYDFVRVPLLLYAIAGVPIVRWNSKDKLSISQIIAMLVALINLSYNMVTKIAFLFYGEIKGAKDLTLLICYWVLVLNSLTKMFTVWYGRKNIREVFMQMKESFPHTEALEREYKVGEYYKKIQRYSYCLAVLNIGAVQGFNFFPLVQSLVEYYFSFEEKRIFNKRFPYMLYYNFDTAHFPNYIFAYFIQCLGATTLEFFFLGSDLLLTTSVHLQNMHFEYLAKRIQSLVPTGTDEDLRKLNELIKHHSDIIINCKKIDQTFSFSILLHYISSGIVICMMAFQIMAGTEGIILIKFMLMLISSMVHIYFICTFGTEMITLSTDVSDAFSHHQWYLGTVKYQRMLPLAIARAQKSVHLSAFKFFNISMESFQTLVTISYQFFTLLSTKLIE